MKTLILITFVFSCIGCTKADSNLAASADQSICKAAWTELGKSQQAEFASEDAFVKRCGASAWVSKCKDGHVDFAKESQNLCLENGGVERDLKFPDG
jgi:hypothetical protein